MRHIELLDEASLECTPRPQEVDVYLDDVKLLRCVEASAIEGWARVRVKANGQAMMSLPLEYEVKHGRIRIERRLP